MTEKLKQIIKDEIAKLPKEKQEAINSIDWVKISEEIGKKYLLNESELNDLLVQVLLVLIGLTDIEDSAPGIENEVGVSTGIANKLASEIIQKIFIPITDAGIENIKKGWKVANSSPEQTLNFILSDGDYSVFAEPSFPPRLEKEGAGGGNSLSTTSPSALLLHKEESRIPMKPKITDIKSKFTI